MKMSQEIIIENIFNEEIRKLNKVIRYSQTMDIAKTKIILIGLKKKVIKLKEMENEKND